MWSLPDIGAMNKAAASNKQRLEDCARNYRTPENMRKTAKCDCSDWGGTKCSGDLGSYLWYDIFSDDPKGVIFLCSSHDGYSGSPLEGYFSCDHCGRVMIENYTWELYFTDTEEGRLCLNCFARSIIDNPDEWLPTDEETVKSLTFDRVRQAKHIFAVSGPRHGLTEFGDGATFDSMTGETVVGTSSTTSFDYGLRDLQDSMRDARDAGCDKVLLVLDGGYQFACSIGVYGIPPKPQGSEEKALPTLPTSPALKKRKVRAKSKQGGRATSQDGECIRHHDAESFPAPTTKGE